MGRKGRRRIKKKKTMTTTLHIPHELIIQILQRLPVKSLICFKSVCKSWFSLISHDPHFANSQFDLTAATHTRRIVPISTSPLETRSFNVEASLSDDFAVSASPNFNFLSPLSYIYLRVKGSCRRFIFFHCYPNLYLWNPSTGVHKQIPEFIMPSDNGNDFYGFGYDQSTDDYLVVSIHWAIDETTDDFP